MLVTNEILKGCVLIYFPFWESAREEQLQCIFVATYMWAILESSCNACSEVGTKAIVYMYACNSSCVWNYPCLQRLALFRNALSCKFGMRRIVGIWLKQVRFNLQTALHC